MARYNGYSRSMWDDKPTVDSIMAVENHFRSMWSETHAKWRQVDTYYWNTFGLWPEGVNRPISRPATPRSLIDHAVDVMMTFEPTVSRYSHGDYSEQENTDNLELYLRSAITEAAALEVVPPFKTAGKYLLLYGCGVLEGPLLDYSNHPEEPDEDSSDYSKERRQYRRLRRAWMPFRIRAPHPGTVLLDPTDCNSPFAVKRYWKYAGELYRLVQSKGRRTFNKPSDPYARVECIEYWTKHWHAVIAETRLLYIEENTWGFVPFSYGFSGFGSEIMSQEHMNPSYQAVGLIDPVMDSLRRNAQEVAAKHNMLVNSAFPPLATRDNAADIVQQLARGEVLEGINQSDVWWMQFPDAPQWFFQAGAETLRDIQQGTYSPSLGGFREQGVRTVGQQAILSTAATRKFRSPGYQLDRMATQVAANMLRLIEILDESLTSGGITVKGSDVDGEYDNIQVRFELIDPVLQLQQRQVALQERDRGLISDETYRANFARIEDEAGERRRILKEKVLQSPLIQQFLAEQVMREEKLDQVIDRMEQEAQQEQENQAMMGAQQGAPGGEFGDMAAPGGFPTANPPMPGSPAEAASTLRGIRMPLTPNTPKPALRR